MPNPADLHGQHVGLNAVNDQVLTAISLNYGKNAAQPGADLQKTLSPIVDAELYRQRFRVFSRIVTPAAGAGTITWVFRPTGFERWRVLAGALENGDAANAMVIRTGVRDQANITGERRVGNFRIPPSQNLPFIGRQVQATLTAQGAGSTNQGEVPAFVDVPRSDELLLIVSTGVFDGSEIAVRMLVEVLPQEVSMILTLPTTEIVP